MKKNAIIAMLFSAVLFMGCGAKSETANMSEATYVARGSEYSYDSIVEYDAAEEAYMDDSFDMEAAGNGQSYVDNRKLITTVDMDVETEEFDAMYSEIERRAKELGGYIEYSSMITNSYNGLKTGYLRIRITEENLDSFVTMIDSEGNVISKGRNVEDITLTYVDTESRKTVYEEEMKLLTQMMEEAEDMETLLQIESRLSVVRADVEAMESQLRIYDNLCNFATLNISIEEVEVYTPVETKEQTVFEKMGQGFVKNLKGVGKFLESFAIFIVVNIPVFVLLGFFAFIIIMIIKVCVRISNKSLEKKVAKLNQKKAMLEETDSKETTDEEK